MIYFVKHRFIPIMEITCYYYHGNTISKAFAFIKEHDSIYVDVVYFRRKSSGLNLTKCDFVISFDDLKQYKKLSEYYELSLILTKKNTQLEYKEEGDFMGFDAHKWCIPCKRNWKGVCYSDKYICNYGFTHYPQNPTKIKHKDMNSLKITYYNNFLEKQEQKDTVDYLALYVEQEIAKISFQLEALEFQVEKDKDLMKKVYILGNILPKDILNKILFMISK